MRSTLAALAVMVAVLGIVAAAVAAGDRSLLVPPPDAVAESFTHAVLVGRYRPAQNYLSETTAAHPFEIADLRRVADTLVDGVPEVEAAVVMQDRQSAVVTVTLRGRRHSTGRLRVGLRFERGEWKVETVAPAGPPIER